MSRTVLEAVPNFSEGRRLEVVGEIVARIVSVPGVDVASQDSDPDHNRSVITFLGPPGAVEEAAVRSAHVAVERIDLRGHRGVHPRIGALDVLPFVPLKGATLKEVAALARSAARRIAGEVGVPVYLYGEASDPPGLPLFELRRLAGAASLPGAREPDARPPGWPRGSLHSTAGAVCVGARGPLLAWNVYLEGAADLELAREIAAEIRERGGGFQGLRALGLRLDGSNRIQVSMNLERPAETSVEEVYRTIDRSAKQGGSAAGEIEIVGLIPDEAAAAFANLGLPRLSERLISTWVARNVGQRGTGG